MRKFTTMLLPAAATAALFLVACDHDRPASVPPAPTSNTGGPCGDGRVLGPNEVCP